MLCGLLGAIAAVILLAVLKFTIVDQVLQVSSGPLQQQSGSTIGLPALAVILILAGALLGALGSGITLRRFLRV
jgi:cell division protein FtsX